MNAERDFDMMRKKVWLAFVAMMLGVSWASAQGPMPMYPPMPPQHGYPPPGYYGRPMAPYGQQPMPMMPPTGYRPGTPYPMQPIPPMQPMPMVPALPTHYGPLPASEPLYVLPPAAEAKLSEKETSPASATPTTETLPEMYDGPVIDPGPAEPYTLYEGRRYRADYKNDHARVWMQASYIHWWVRGDSPPPLVTTGANDSLGALGEPGTTVLLGNDSVASKEFSGILATVGIWLDCDKACALEFGGFWLGNSSRQYRFASDANGNPILAQPVQIPEERALVVSFPDFFAGSISVNSVMDFYGAEMNLVRNLYRVEGCSIDYLIGARYLYLRDELTMHQDVTLLANGIIPFLGVEQGAGSNFMFDDSFRSVNRFYGGQIGTRFNYTYCKWDVGATLKLAMGVTTHVVDIDGATTLNATTTAPGGTIAQPSNMGRHSSSQFSVVPEVNASVGYQVFPAVRLMVGYNFLYWGRVLRAANQIDRQIDFAQSPTSGALPVAATSPQFPNSRSDFWAHGINLGIEIKY
jgi:hypothetical protein